MRNLTSDNRGFGDCADVSALKITGSASVAELSLSSPTLLLGKVSESALFRISLYAAIAASKDRLLRRDSATSAKLYPISVR